MPGCANGAEPLPGISGGTVILQVTTTVLGDLAGLLGGLWGEVAIQPVLMHMSIDNLCALNPSDPGPPSTADLVATANFLAPFGANPMGAEIPSWLLAQVQYQFFTSSCRCVDAAPIPPRVPVALPPDYPHYPPSADGNPQLTRIETNQQTSGDALTTLYLGLQRTATDVWDLRMRQVQNIIQHYGTPIATMTGEGNVALAPFQNSGGESSQDTLGVFVSVDQLPTVFKQQGTLVPRYYGIGSVMFDAMFPGNGEPIITGRRSLHYRTEFVEAPQLAQSFALHWRLMPGASARVWQLFRSVDSAIYTYGRAYQSAFDRFDVLPMPPDWTDSPFFPKPTREHHRTTWALRQCQPTPFDV